MQGIGSLFLQPVDRLSSASLSMHWDHHFSPEVLLCLTRAVGLGSRFTGVWCCVP